MKKVLIFTASTGGGHNQVATSLEKEFYSHGYQVIKLDVLKETNRILDILIADGYTVLANNLPRVYGGIYRISDRKRINSRITSLFTKIASKKIYELIKENNPDIIIGTHPLIVNVIGKLKDESKINTPFISIVTDYQAHQTYINENVDAYIIGSYYTGMSLIERGVPKDKIHPYGIPIRREFLENNPYKIKKGKRKFTILLMGGSMGIKSMKSVLKRLLDNDNELKIVIICGKNKMLKKIAEKRYKDKFKNKELIVYGFTKDIPQLMEISDIIITKPGGLTTSEAIAKNVPMLIPFLIPGQEEENAEFLVKSQVAIRINEIKEINGIIDYLIDNPQVLDKMRKNMKKLSEIYSIENIIKLADTLITQSKYDWRMIYGQEV